MASLVGTYAKEAFATGAINWTTADVRCALSTGFSFNVDSHRYLSDMTNECVGTGYARKVLAGKAVSRVTGGVELKADDPTWTGANFGTPSHAVIYVYNAADSAALIIGVLDQNDIPTNTGDYQLKWDGQASNGKLFTM